MARSSSSLWRLLSYTGRALSAHASPACEGTLARSRWIPGLEQDRSLWSWILHRNYAKNTKKADDVDDDDGYADPRSRPNAAKGPRMNRAITDRFVRVVSSEGHTVMTREEALRKAEEQGLDLVEVDPTNNPVVCKIMDYKKEKYKEKVREKEHKKKTLDSRRLSELKELQVSSKIDERDLEMKAENASRLIQRGHRLKCVVKLPQKPGKDDDDKGPVKSDPKALRVIDKLIELLKDVSKLEQGPQSERHRAWAILRPLPPPAKQKGSSPKAPAKDAPASKDSKDGTASKKTEKPA